MSNSAKTTCWAFPTRLTDVATNTTLAGATRHDFASKTITMSETSRTIKSAVLRFTFFVSDPSVALDIDAVRLGAKVNAAAFTDVDTTYTATNTGEAETMELLLDFTSNLVTNIGAGTTFTLQGGIAVATGSASNIRNITCEAIITYEYDNTTATQVKSVRIPIQSDTTDLSATYAEVGSTGTAGAPANQIPQLTGAGSPFLTEASVTIVDQYIVCVSHSYSSPATTDHNMDVRLDGATTLTRATIEAALQTSITVYDIIDSSLMPSTTAAHAFEVRSSLADRFWGTGGYMIVTYTFDTTTTTTVVNSVIVPLENERSTVTGSACVSGTQNVRLVAKLHVLETSLVALLNTGVVLFGGTQGAQTINVAAEGQTTRPYVGVASQVLTALFQITHRTDHSSSTWSLARGENTLGIDVANTVDGHRPYSGYAIINYTSALSAQGIGAHVRTLQYFQKAMEGTPVASGTVSAIAPNIPEATWRVSGVFVDVRCRTTDPRMAVSMERLADEDSGEGWYIAVQVDGNISGELGTKQFCPAITQWFRLWSYQEAFGTSGDAFGARLEIGSRPWRFAAGAGVNATYSSMLMFTYSAYSYTVAGTISEDGTGTVRDYKIFAEDTATREIHRVHSATAAGGGAVSVEVPDDTRSYFVMVPAAPVGVSEPGVPEVDTFDVDITVTPSGGLGTASIGPHFIR